MKNREKFRSEIVEAIKEDNANNEKMCCFVQDNVIPLFVSEEDMEGSMCGGMSCHTCEKMFTFWLDEEYTEPPKPEVDWDNIPVDTLVRVRDNDNEEWVLQYFKGIDKKRKTLKYMAWSYGATSATAQGNSTHWQYCELVEEEYDGCN